MEQAADFLAETEALHALIADLPADDFARPTAFKEWSVDHILQHLHFFNDMAMLSLTDADKFTARYAEFKTGQKADGSMLPVTDRMLEGLSGPVLRQRWLDTAQVVSEAFGNADPKARVNWAGPDMSARSSISARLMETWAHGQAIYDLLGVERKDHDRIRNIAHLGVNTYGWTFQNRGEAVPDPMPYVQLEAPAGGIWEWGTPSEDERISGPATDFCQVVCQTRNIADVRLEVCGPNATRWMALAQCFAGPPVDPPARGTRKRAT